MVKKILVLAALLVLGGAAFLVSQNQQSAGRGSRPNGIVQVRGSRFLLDGKPFRFVGANVSVMYRDEDRAAMPETLKRAADSGIRVVRVWAYGEGGPEDIGPLADFADWPRTHPFRWAPGQWNEEAFVHLDRVIAEAAKNNLKVQLCLTNWWRDTGGIAQYLRWAGINDAADERFRFGINPEIAMQFYTNDTTRKLYKEHIEKLATRTNSVTGVPYRDDPTIFGWELMNEAQALTGRWGERRAWISEMTTYLRSLDSNHIISPGTWGYRTASERREWLIDHQLPNVDYCDVHNYPKDDTDSFVDSPKTLQDFLDNRAAAAFSIKKPLVMGEFGINADGFNGFSQAEWYRAYLQGSVKSGAAGAMFWILTPDPRRGYGITYTTDRDRTVFDEISRAAKMFSALESADPPARLLDADAHLVPRQFAWSKEEGDWSIEPQVFLREDKTLLYRFKPQMASASRFEKWGAGPGYFWGYGVGAIDFIVPKREDHRRVKEVVVRAHIQPVPPIDAKKDWLRTRVTLFINNTNCGSRLIPVEDEKQPLIQEWKVDKLAVRLAAMRGQRLRIRFAVTADADWAYGVNISNWPEGYQSNDAKPVEVEVRHAGE